jgi:alpha-glucosidase
MTKKSYRGITPAWWKESVVYQIYPRSFKDSNGDGIGDLNGIYEKLDYLQALGVETLWLCPIFKSPQDDNGYDVSDYQDIHAEFGTLEDFQRLLKETHRRGMRLVLDLVLNHTSDEHPWFLESRSSPDNPKRDWYIWQDGKDGREPNNWESIFGGSAWKYDEKTRQYFLHLFSERQPDLNWENYEMRKCVYEMIRWWLDQDIDGFRLDAITHMKKEEGFPDLPNPHGKDYVNSMPMQMNRPGVLDYVADVCNNTFNHYDIVTVGEANGVSAEDAPLWVAEEAKKLSMVIQFEHVELWAEAGEKALDVNKLKRIFTRWQKELDQKGWNALFVENHDLPRIVSKWGQEKYREESAKAIAAMYFLMQGTPFIYQGQELGMTNTTFATAGDFNDIRAKNIFAERRREGIPDEVTLREIAAESRDNARTPMPWSAQAQAGFTTGHPWLKLNPSYREINVEKQMQDPHSVWSFYRDLIRLRHENKALVYGDYELLWARHPQVYGYKRELNDKIFIIVSNLSERNLSLDYEGGLSEKSQIRLKNYPHEAPRDSAKLFLRPFECAVFEL